MSHYSSVAMMELYIETLTGVLMELIVHPYETIYNVKAKINKLEGFPISEQHLIWQSMELDNEMSLQHYRIPDGATLRLVLNMRGGPVNTRRVPLEESSLREMAEYFSDPVGDEHTSGDRPVTVIVYQQGEHINFFRLVDRDTSSSLSYSLSGGSDFHGEEDSPVPKEQQEENEKTRNKMKMLKEQMENLTLLKEKKQSVKRNRLPRQPSAGRPQSRTKLRHISMATGKPSALLNKNARLPPVGQSLLLPPPLEETSVVENPAMVERTVAVVPVRSEASCVKSPTRMETTSAEIPVRAETSGVENPIAVEASSAEHPKIIETSSVENPLTAQTQVSSHSAKVLLTSSDSSVPLTLLKTSATVKADNRKSSVLEQTALMNSSTPPPKLPSTSSSAKASDLLSSMSVPSIANESDAAVNGAVDTCSPRLPNQNIALRKSSDPNTSRMLPKADVKICDNRTVMNNVDKSDADSQENVLVSSTNHHSGPTETVFNANEQQKPGFPAREMIPSVNSLLYPNSMKTSRTVAAPVLPHPPLPPSRYLPFGPATSGRLVQQQLPSDAAKNGYDDGNHPTEAVLGYLMSPTRRTGAERKAGGVTLQSLNHKEARAVSGMLRSIVRSANRSQAGYLVTSRKLTHVPSPTPAADVVIPDPSSILRVLSGSRDGRATPVRVRLPSVRVTKKKVVKRCALCKKRTKLSTGFQCRCGENYCLTHLCAEAHGCTYDYKTEGRKLIEQSNPVVTAPKLPKI